LLPGVVSAVKTIVDKTQMCPKDEVDFTKYFLFLSNPVDENGTCHKSL